MLQSTDPERLGNKEGSWWGMPGSPWKKEIGEISWVDLGQVRLWTWGIRLGKMKGEGTEWDYWKGGGISRSGKKPDARGSPKMTPAKTPRNCRCTAWTGHLVWPDWYLGQLSSERLHPATNGNKCRRGRGRIVGTRGVKDTTRKPTESTNLSSQELRVWTNNQGACMGLT